MSSTSFPETVNPIASLEDLSIMPDPIQTMPIPNLDLIPKVENVKMKQSNIFYNSSKVTPDITVPAESKEVDRTNIDFSVLEIPEEKPKKKRGKRGKDSKPRKKRELTDKQREALKKGREKSAVVRRAKRDARLAKEQKTQPIEIPKQVMPPPAVHKPLDYNTFCSYMDMYSEKVKKKHTNNKQPHPNKVISSQQRPQPPISKPNPRVRRRQQRPQTPVPEPVQEMGTWTGTFRNISTNNRWDFGL